ncbi:response regulator transcription factor [Sphingomicrobium arenosum]|uniref:response regulator transcription factor n=1 Tax=Sphingomicrobium arenosum TaxID=2233861 RepID=UPI00223EF4D4|nr:response regulator transcription factor [Sphingomicrobium arenosum]
MTESARILLVEDEPTLATQIAAGLRREAWVVDHVGCLSDAIEALLTASFRLILLDRRLPDGDGLALVKVAKSRPSPPAIIFLTARDQIEDRVEGLDAGAEDYLVKPFALNELLARVRAACRRQPQGMADHRITVGRLAFVPTTREVEIAGRPIRLPRRELLLLELLAARAGRVVQRDRLDAEIYGFETNVSSNALETHVSRLRRRLVDLEAGATIVTVRGVGYMLRPL